MSAIEISNFFDPATNTFSYLISCKKTKECAVIDSVLDFNPLTGELSAAGIQPLIESITNQGLQLKYILETHVHADHLTASYYLQQRLGGKLGISSQVVKIQQAVKQLFNFNDNFNTQGTAFDLLLEDGQELELGTTKIKVMHTPGHTPACISYSIEDAIFVGDTIFMPDYGTARCDFPDASAQQLYASIQKLLSLPPATKMYMCHDYLPTGRSEYQYLTSVAEQLAHNVFLQQVNSAQEFASLRQTRDAQLGLPKLIYPALQINSQAGRLPKAESNNQSYLKLPITFKE